MESILSIMLLSVMMLSVSTMINVAVNQMTSSVEASKKNQEIVNKATLEKYDSRTSEVVLYFQDPAGGIINTHLPVIVFYGENFTSFSPKVVQ